MSNQHPGRVEDQLKSGSIGSVEDVVTSLNGQKIQ